MKMIIFRRIIDIFFVFAQNIDYGYLLELPHLGGSNEYQQSVLGKSKENAYPVNLNFTINDLELTLNLYLVLYAS